RRKGITIDIEGLERSMGVPVVAINPRKNKGISQLKKTISDVYQQKVTGQREDFIDVRAITGDWIDELITICNLESNYKALHVACNYLELGYLQAAQKIQIAALLDVNN